MTILPYQMQPIQFLPYNVNLPKVADAVSHLIADAIPNAHPEHIGSTVVPGMPGKNIINLIVPSSLEQFNQRLQILERLGFQASPLNKSEPSYRPLRVASVQYQSQIYNIHIHLIVEGSNDLAGARFFRDFLIQHPSEQKIYAEIKKQAVEAGKTDPVSYNVAKEPFIRSVLAKMRLRGDN